MAVGLRLVRNDLGARQSLRCEPFEPGAFTGKFADGTCRFDFQNERFMFVMIEKQDIGGRAAKLILLAAITGKPMQQCIGQIESSQNRIGHITLPYQALSRT